MIDCEDNASAFKTSQNKHLSKTSIFIVAIFMFSYNTIFLFLFKLKHSRELNQKKSVIFIALKAFFLFD